MVYHGTVVVLPWYNMLYHGVIPWYIILTMVHQIYTMVHNGNTMVYHGTIIVLSWYTMVQHVIPWCDCGVHIFTVVHRVITMVHNGNTIVYHGTIKVYHGTTCDWVVNYFYHGTSYNNHGT